MISPIRAHAMPAPTAVSEFAALEATLEARRLQVEAALRRLHAPGRSTPVSAAIEDSLFAPAKRLRPILSLLVADILRGEPESLLPAGCAIEMIHTASLILDDLPSMDDAMTRRGRPTCHVAHGESTAILAAFALMSRAFEILAEGWEGAPDPADRAIIARELARAVGLDGMIAGQAADLAMTDDPIDFPALEYIHSRKTGALFIASATLGAAAAHGSPADKAAVTAYARNLALAFQIVDELIDATGEAAEAGKDVGKDLGKTTFVSLSGVDGAKALACDLIAASQEALDGFGSRAQPLRDLARYVVTRRK